NARPIILCFILFVNRQNNQKLSPSLEGDCISFTNGDLYRNRLFFTQKSVISDKLPNTHILPGCPVFVFIAYSIIAAQRQKPIIDETVGERHLVILGTSIISCVF